MKLFIAEKPSLGRAIAAALPKPHKKKEGFIETGNGDIVTWCIGHILEQAEPDDYDPRYKQWRIEHLPISPTEWQLKPKYKTRSQLTTIKKLVKTAAVIVNAGDPDREGQLLVDEVLNYLKLPKQKLAACERLLISDLNLSAVKRALNKLEPNRNYAALSISALARSRADWLYGMNMTRLYTLQGKKVGYNSVLSVGRVQTPVLGLVVKRDLEIENFQPKNYYEVQAHILVEQQVVSAQWKPSEACQPYMDEAGRVLNKALAENVVSRITGQPATVKKLKKQQKTQNAPLPYNLSSLQIDAAKAFNLSAKQVLDTCQSLYEKHNLITYPRSDCRYLPTEHHKMAPSILSHLQNSVLSIASHLDEADSSLISKAFNDKNVGAHHAIVPTEKPSQKTNLNTTELKVYGLIARQYAAQFFPAYRYDFTQVDFEIAGGLFITKENVPSSLGWKVLIKTNKDSTQNRSSQETSQKNNDANLPQMNEGEVYVCDRGEILEKITQPPNHFTDATLLAAMTGIGKFVTDPDIKKILKETDGLGTEATRAGIIELLFKRGYLEKRGKSICATEVGRALIKVLPVQASSPDMTAMWEATLNDISEKRVNYDEFMSPLLFSLEQLISHALQQDFSHLPKQAYKPKRKFSRSKKQGKTRGSKS